MGSTVIGLSGVSLLEGEQIHDGNTLEQTGHPNVVAAAEDPGAKPIAAANAGQNPRPQVVPDAVQP